MTKLFFCILDAQEGNASLGKDTLLSAGGLCTPSSTCLREMGGRWLGAAEAFPPFTGHLSTQLGFLQAEPPIWGEKYAPTQETSVHSWRKLSRSTCCHCQAWTLRSLRSNGQCKRLIYKLFWGVSNCASQLSIQVGTASKARLGWCTCRITSTSGLF